MSNGHFSERPSADDPACASAFPHRWVGAALVDVGTGVHDGRAEHAARTGRYTVPAATRIEVLEVYCADCRAPYHPLRAGGGCPARLHPRVRVGRTLRAAQ